jgi:hypothetical protein
MERNLSLPDSVKEGGVGGLHVYLADKDRLYRRPRRRYIYQRVVRMACGPAFSPGPGDRDAGWPTRATRSEDIPEAFMCRDFPQMSAY